MSVKELEFYHGSVLHRLVNNVALRSIEQLTSSIYLINGNTALYVKYCSNRLTPWTFSFMPAHQNELNESALKYKNLWVVLVCGMDGITCLDISEISSVIVLDAYRTRTIRLNRHKNEKYFLTGSNGELKKKLGEVDFPKKIRTLYL